MRRALIVGAAVLVAAVACVALIALLASRDQGGVGATAGPGVLEPDRGSERLGENDPATPVSAPDDPPTSGPHHPEPVERDATELSEDQLLEALALGNVVLVYDGDEPPAALTALQDEVTGAFDPEVAAAGGSVILARRPGAGGVIALAWRRKLEASGPDDPALREFVEAYLGQGAASAPR